MSEEIVSEFKNRARHYLLESYLPKIEKCVARLSEEDVWWRPAEASNSVGNLLLHLTGNVRQWILGGVGGKEIERARQREFDERAHIPKDELLANLSAAVREAVEIIAALDESESLERRTIQGSDVTKLAAIFHVVEHFSQHTGQIIVITKMRLGEDLKLWQPRASVK